MEQNSEKSQKVIVKPTAQDSGADAVKEVMNTGRNAPSASPTNPGIFY